MFRVSSATKRITLYVLLHPAPDVLFSVHTMPKLLGLAHEGLYNFSSKTRKLQKCLLICLVRKNQTRRG